MNRKQVAALAITGIVITAVVVGVIIYYRLRITGTGRITVIGLEAYADAECTKQVSAINWGEISPSGYSQATLYLKSTSNKPVNLTLTTENWSPSVAEQYLTLTWNYAGDVLQPSEVRAVIFTLSVSADVTGVTDFSHDMILTAAG